jgi:prevent-host-death family protein
VTEVPVREIRNNTRGVLDRVRAGEVLTITVDGRPAAELRPLGARPRFMDRASFVALVAARQADPGLAADLAHLAPDITDDVPW